MELVEQLLSGDRRAAARVISLIENGDAHVQEYLAALHEHTGRAHVIGVTGAPGTGKSTLVSALAKEERKRGRRVGIISVDPSSPFTGGALLGDRIRMMDLSGDRGVFMRSMATRGKVGGLAVATADAVRVLDAFGSEIIFVETVGAGQAEVEIAKTAHTTIVVEAPGLGDEIQAFKAGILEIADVFVVNKADREGADNTANALRTMLDVGSPKRKGASAVEQPGAQAEAAPSNWRPPILKTIATEEQGIAPVADALDWHLEYLKETGRFALRERERITGELRNLLARALLDERLQALGDGTFARMVEAIAERKVDPHSAARELMGNLEHP
ncbi:MAG: methylmalonyl Co-A mutase-associated GTPase MeaB [Chloroflexi bacterium]|nr:MAG: methylmalonyl Co-A mutase-associated GTPase MeaB [Chloroflexota bacterium]